MRSKYRTPDQHAASYDEAQRVSTSKVFGADHRFTFDLLIFSARARITVAPPSIEKCQFRIILDGL